MDKQPHQNFIKSSNLIFGTVGLGLINYFFSSELLSNGKNIANAVITLLLIAGLAYLVRQGLKWVKYLLLVLTITGLIGMMFMINSIAQKPVVGLIIIVQTIMQTWATVLLFKVPKTIENKTVDNTSSSRTCVP